MRLLEHHAVERLHPELQLLRRLLGGAEIAPGVAGDKPRNRGIAALQPEGIERPIVGRPCRMIGRPDDSAESAAPESQGAGVRLPGIEKGVAEAATPVPIAAGESVIQSQVTIVWEIK